MSSLGWRPEGSWKVALKDDLVEGGRVWWREGKEKKVAPVVC